ncbi:MAG: ribosome-associated translation inhibitor RaiA [Prevotellaceae bacterium]|jgi:putative sigma-54 modulation protein|nr:ribosome-associated translation inhibitor RaiA [Prevotellaceae bacterium]
MEIQTQSIKFTADQKLLAFVEKKVGHLDKYYEGIVGAEVLLSIENASDAKNKVVKIRLDVAGTSLFADCKCKTFEEAIDLNVEVLKKQIVKHKEKLREN